MDKRVAPVRAFLRLHRHLTVTTSPVVRAARGGGHERVTELDVLAFRFGETPDSCGPVDHPASNERHTMLGVPADVRHDHRRIGKGGGAELSGPRARSLRLELSVRRPVASGLVR